MKHKVEKHHRRSIRLKGYDYANSGAYFVTIVMQGRACLFGEIVNAETRLTDAGSAIERWWFELNNKFSTVETDDFVIMPNHFHGIVVIPVGADLCVGPDSEGAHIGAPLQWQRNYYEHVIRDEGSLNRIREYILNNPAQWARDPENPAATAAEPPDIWRLQARHENKGDQPVAPTKDVRNT